MTTILILAAILAFTLWSRGEFRRKLRPMQVVGARIGDEVINVTILSVDHGLEQATVLVGESKKQATLSFRHIYLPSRDAS